MTKKIMIDKSDIIEEHLLGRKLIGVWEMISDSFPTTVEGYALSLEGYFLEIETMLDVSAIGIACGHSRIDFPLDVRPGCTYHEVSNDSPFSQLLGKRFSKWRLLVSERDYWEGLMLSFGKSAGFCFISVDYTISVLTLNGKQC
jgi:hypothetical protein